MAQQLYLCALDPTDSGWGILVENNERVIFDMTSEDRFGVSACPIPFAQFIEARVQQNYYTGKALFWSMECPNWTQKHHSAHGGAESVLQTAQEAISAGVPITGIWIEDWCVARHAPGRVCGGTDCGQRNTPNGKP